MVASTGTTVALARKQSGKIFMPPASKLTPAQIIKWQRRIIRHDKWVIHTANTHTRAIVEFHRHQLVWVSRELHKNVKRTIVSTAQNNGRVLYLDASNPQNNYSIVAPVIYRVFGRYGSQAVVVSGCETGHKYNTNAKNGQYIGLFQMGDNERATYGNARDVVGEVEAAHRYFVASGSDWSPWSCKP